MPSCTMVLLLMSTAILIAGYAHGAIPSAPRRLLEPRLYNQSELVGTSLEERQGMNWVVQTEYAGTTFFDGWEFFDEPDPSNGYVNYVPRDQAFSEGLAFWTQDGTPGIQADHWTTLASDKNRDSVRITSNSLFAGGLFIVDLRLMPWGCGVWPAFWLLGYGAPWPTVGEIDIIEGIQAMSTNQYTIHTNPGCTVNTTQGLYRGTVTNPVCDRESGGTGCSIISPSQSSFGMPFNEAGGGVFAMLWDQTGIRMWSWNRNAIPQDINDQHPSPDSWGLPDAAFDASTCNPNTFFSAQTLVLNINLCGDWAGGLYSQYNYCPGSCRSYIENPANLVNTVMLINYIRVYQLSGSPSNIVGQAHGNSNLTGAGGAVSIGDRPNSAFERLSNPSVPVQVLLVLLAVLTLDVYRLWEDWEGPRWEWARRKARIGTGRSKKTSREYRKLRRRLKISSSTKNTKGRPKRSQAGQAAV